MKRCKACGEAKPLDDFYANRLGRDGRRPECKACTSATRKERYRQNPQKYVDRVKRWQRENREKYNAKQAKWRAENPDRIREGHLLRKYGITQADYEGMLQEQAGGCSICGDPPPEKVSLHVDHDHDTGAVRGLLCVRCNNAIGMLRENVDLLTLVAEYLEVPGPVRTRLQRHIVTIRDRALGLRPEASV